MVDVKHNLHEVLFQFAVYGNFVKVMAVDPITGIEVVLIGDKRESQKTLEKLAVQKLLLALRRKRRVSVENNEEIFL